MDNENSDILSKNKMQQIFTFNKLYKIGQEITKKPTIIFYCQYDRVHNDYRNVNNAKVFAQMFLDEELKSEVYVRGEKKQKQYAFTKKGEEISKVKLTIKQYELYQKGSQERGFIHNIWSYQNSEYRAVVLPIMLQVMKKSNQNKKFEQIDEKVKGSFNFGYLAGDQRKKKQKQQKDQLSVIFAQRVAEATIKHLHLLNLSDIIGNYLSVNSLVSVICVCQESKWKKEKSVFKECYKNIFESKIDPRFLIYSYKKKKKNSSDQSQDNQVNILSEKEVCVILTGAKTHKKSQKKPQSSESIYTDSNASSSPSKNSQKSIVQEKNVLSSNKKEQAIIQQQNAQCYFIKEVKPLKIKQHNFVDGGGIRLKLYSNLKDFKFYLNNAMDKVIQDFSDGWRQILIDCFKVVVYVFQVVNKTIGGDVLEYKKPLNFSKFLRKYNISQLGLTKTHLNGYYTKQNMGIPSAQDPVQIPNQMANIAFIHFFDKIRKEMLAENEKNKFSSEEIKYQGMLKYINLIFRLMAQANNTLLSGEDKCEDISLFYSFIVFVFQTISKFKKLSLTIAPFIDEVKSIIQQLKNKQNKLISYILQKQDQINKTNDSLLYYDLYLQIIQQSKKAANNNRIDHLEAYIQQYKAYCIAYNYIYDPQKVVQAIKCYGQVAVKYKELNKTKKIMIDIHQISQKTARLLTYVNQQQISVEIYFSLMKFGQAYKLLERIKSNYRGDQKAKKLIYWGRRFQQNFQYELALNFYREAFDVAHDVGIQREALQCRQNCRVKMRNGESQKEMVNTKKFLNEGSIDQYVNLAGLLDIFAKMPRLHYNEIDECTSFV